MKLRANQPIVYGCALQRQINCRLISWECRASSGFCPPQNKEALTGSRGQSLKCIRNGGRESGPWRDRSEHGCSICGDGETVVNSEAGNQSGPDGVNICEHASFRRFRLGFRGRSVVGLQPPWQNHHGNAKVAGREARYITPTLLPLLSRRGFFARTPPAGSISLLDRTSRILGQRVDAAPALPCAAMGFGARLILER